MLTHSACLPRQEESPARRSSPSFYIQNGIDKYLIKVYKKLRHNRAVIGYIHDDATRKAILAFVGLLDGPNAPKDAVTLNDLEDIETIRRQVLGLPMDVTFAELKAKAAELEEPAIADAAPPPAAEGTVTAGG